MQTMKRFHAELQPSQKPQKPEARSQKPKARRSQKPGARRSQKPEVRSQEPEAKSQKPKARSQKPEAKSQKPKPAKEMQEKNSLCQSVYQSISMYIKHHQAIDRWPWISIELIASQLFSPRIGKSRWRVTRGSNCWTVPAETSKPDAKIFLRTTCTMTHTDTVCCLKAKSAAVLTRAKWNPNHTKCVFASPSQHYSFN